MSSILLKNPRNKRSSKKKLSLQQSIPNIPVRTDESALDISSFLMSQDDYLDWYEEECISELKLPAKPKLTRTELLLLDYKQFKAARVIQKYFRRWYCQRVYHRKRRAAITIQAEWRRFHTQRVFYCRLERTLQQRIEAFYYRKAQMIQALWRGFWSRINIHNHSALIQTQVASAEDLLQCVAFKLHHLLRTYQIPGIYSMRNSHCLSKVEKLLADMSFKQHNDQVRLLRANREQRRLDAYRCFEKTAYATLLPYGGPNVHGLCDPKCEALYKAKDVDRRMFKILTMYENATREAKSTKHNKPKRIFKSKKIMKIMAKIGKPTDFCTDIVTSMRRWHILDENNITVNRNIFKHPEKLENFLHEIESIYSMMRPKCVCSIDEDPLMCK